MLLYTVYYTLRNFSELTSYYTCNERSKNSLMNDGMTKKLVRIMEVQRISASKQIQTAVQYGAEQN